MKYRVDMTSSWRVFLHRSAGMGVRAVRDNLQVRGGSGPTSCGRLGWRFILAAVMASAAQWERRIIGQRTREGMAAKRAVGVRLGPPRRLPDHVARQIIGLRSSGIAWVRVAEILNELGVPTALAGRQWYPSTARNAALAYERDMARATGPSQ